MRCPDCNKFVGMENGDLEVDSLEIDVDGTVSVSASLPRNCAECSTELKRGHFQVDEDVTDLQPAECPGYVGEDEAKPHALEIEEVSNDVSESGGGRYAKNMIGFEVQYKVRCTACELVVEGTIGDAMNAGSFEESV